MAVLLSNATAVRLRELIAASNRRDPLAARRVDGTASILEDASAQAPAWTVRWSESLSSYIVHIPPGAVRIWLDVPDTLSGAAENIKLVHKPFVAGTATIALAPSGANHWYLFDGTSGNVWMRVHEGEVTVGMVSDLKHGALIAGISSAGGAVKIYQVARSPIEIIISETDADAPEPDPAAADDSQDCGGAFPGASPGSGSTDEMFPGDIIVFPDSDYETIPDGFPGKAYPCW